MELKFSIVKRGYETSEVDLYVEKIEKALNDYRGKETALVRALVNAEDAATKIINDANIEAARIIGDAEINARKTAEDMRYEIVHEICSVKKMIEREKKALTAFCKDFDDIVKNYFTGSAFDITAPLREKLNTMESVIEEITTENSGFFDKTDIPDSPEAENKDTVKEDHDSFEKGANYKDGADKENENVGGYFS